MKKTKTLTLIVVLSLIMVSYNSFAQTAEELLPKAIQLEEVKGELYEAIKTYQLILDQHPDNREVCAEALLHLGMCYEKLGLDQARQTYREVISKYPEQADKTAMARDRISRLDVYTAELLAKAEEHLKKGNELFKRWEYESAIKEYENAIRSGPHTQLALNAQYCIGQSWFRAGKYDEALATFTKLIEENPKSNIAPVTELMVAQVKHAIENDKSQGMTYTSPDEDTIIDPKTGITYTKIRSFVGENDVITNSGGINLSPDGRFMVQDNKVVPVDGSAAFDLVEMNALRTVYAPDMKKAAFYADSAIWTVPVSPQTGHAIGQPKKLLEGYYIFQDLVSWSPDGEKIAFSRRDKTINNKIWTISVSGNNLTPVTNSRDNEAAPEWSPDGKKIVYIRERNLWLSTLDGNETRMIIENGGVPLWSTDSKWIFHSDWERTHLYSFEQDKNFKITFPKQVGDLVFFTPDGGKVLFYRSSSDPKWGVKAVSVSGGPSFTPVLQSPVYGNRWSLNSKHILAQSENENGDIAYKIVPLAGGNPIEVKIDVKINGTPFPFSFSPDLTKLAFSVRREDDKKDLYIVPFSMEEAQTVGSAHLVFEGWTGGAYNVNFSCSPDGTRFALIHKGDIWIVPIEAGNPLQITETPETERWVAWSPDGTMISYIIAGNQPGILHVIPATGGIAKVVYNFCQGSKWSPDSKNIAIISNEKLLIVSLAGKELKHIENIKDLRLGNASDLQYSPDGRYLAFIGYHGDESLIYLYSIESGKFTRLAYDNLDDFKYSLGWSPDGKWLSYLTYEEVKVRPESTIWEADFDEIMNKLAK